jgi:hypothetical protein
MRGELIREQAIPIMIAGQDTGLILAYQETLLLMDVLQEQGTQNPATREYNKHN